MVPNGLGWPPERPPLLGAQPVDQDQQLVRGQPEVHALAQRAILLRLGQVAAQPLGRPS